MKKCRSKCTLIIGIIFMTASLCFVLYPSVSNAVNSFFAASTINNYAANLDSISAADRSQYLSAAAEYNNNLSELVNGFTYDVDSVIDGYDDILNFGDGLIGYIDISKINVKLPIYHGDEDKVLEKGVAHLPMSELHKSADKPKKTHYFGKDKILGRNKSSKQLQNKAVMKSEPKRSEQEL